MGIQDYSTTPVLNGTAAPGITVLDTPPTPLAMPMAVRQIMADIASAGILRSVTEYGAKGDGIADDTASIQAALTANLHVHFPAGTYKITAPLLIRTGSTMTGDGMAASIITTALNIEMVNAKTGGAYNPLFRDLAFVNTFTVSDVAGPGFTATTAVGNSIITGVSSTAGLCKGMRIAGTGIPANTYIRYISGSTIKLGNSVGAAVVATASNTVACTTLFRQGQTVFHMHLNNVGHALIDNCYFKSAFVDTDYSPLNAAGVWFDRDTLSQYFINAVHNSWFDHAQIFMGTSDSSVRGNHVWSNPFNFAVQLSAPGIGVVDNNISAGNLGGIYITATAKETNGGSNHNIVGNNIDCGDIWYAGYGIYAVQPLSVTISGNRVNRCFKAGAYLRDPFGCTVSSNNFLNNNADGLNYSDVELDCVSFQPTTNTISGNAFVQTSSVTPTPGYAIREINSGFYPAGHSYVGNTISGNYASPGIVIVTPMGSGQSPNVAGNSGGGMDSGVKGTFTPTLVGLTTAGTPTYNTSNGDYCITGKICTFRAYVSISAVGGIAGSVVLRGLPVPAAAAVAGGLPFTSLSIGAYSGLTTTGFTQLGAILLPGGSDIKIEMNGSGATSADLPGTALSTTTSLSVSGCYRFD